MSDDLKERLRSNETLPVCPYDRLSPHYLTTPNDKPCVICGQENTSEGPDLCRGADTRVMKEAAARIAELEAQLKNAMGDMAQAEQLISAHVEEYHDFDYEPHAVPAELSSLRFIQHHLLGSMLDEHGDLIAALDPKPTATGETP